MRDKILTNTSQSIGILCENFDARQDISDKVEK